MAFFDDLLLFLGAKSVLHSYKKDLQNQYLHNLAILEERERELRAEEAAQKAEQEAIRQKYEADMKKLCDEIDENHRQSLKKHEAYLAEHEAKIAQLKMAEGDHSKEIEEQEFFAKHERGMIKALKKSLGEE